MSASPVASIAVISFGRWIFSDAALAFRIAVGGLILATLALHDLRKRGRSAQRWREYAFLLFCALAAMLYGIANDQVTSSISWEYYFYGKGLAGVLGPAHVPPAHGPLHWEAAKIGMKATWTAGLLIGAALLIANNPRRDVPRLGYRSLAGHLPLIFAITIAASALSGAAGALSGFSAFSRDFEQMIARNEMRPHRFIAVFGIHLGAYIGGAVGTAIACARITRERRGQGTNG